MLEDLILLESFSNIANEHETEEADLDLDLDLETIGSDVVDGFDADMTSREGWDSEMEEAMDIAMQVVEEKTFPWRGASNVKMPLLTEAAIQFNSMMYPALIPPTEIVKSRVVGKDVDGKKAEQAIRVSKHMSYQVLEEMEEWEEEMDIGLIILPLLGNMYKKAYFDSAKGRNVSEMLSPANFVVNYNTKFLNDAYRKTHVIDMTANDIKKRVISGDFLDVDLGEPKVENKEKEGEEPPMADSGTPYKILECHTYLDLDGDDLEEPYIITVDHNSRKVLRIVAGFNSDDIKMNQEGEVFDVPQEQYFIKYGFIPNPDGGFLDLGLGKLLGPINKTVNTIINQMIDASTQGIMGGGFLGRGIKLKGGNLTFKMGEWKRIDSTGDDLRKNIITLPTKEPSAVLFNLMNLLINSAQRLASTLDSQIGENPGQNQKATTSQIVEQNGMKIFNGIYKRCHRGLKRELKRLFYLNSFNLPAESYLNVLDEAIKPEQAESILRADYNVKSVNIVPAADSKYTSEQVKMAKARSLTEKIASGFVNPEVATRRALQAEEQNGIEEIMKMPPKQPSIEMMKFEEEKKQSLHNKQLDIAKMNLEGLKVKQLELKTRADVILTLAKAESEEKGSQIEQYRTQLQAIAQQGEAVTRKIDAINTLSEQMVSQETAQIQQAKQQQQQRPQQPPQR